MGAPAFLLEGVVEGEEDVFFVGEINFFEIGFPRVVVVKCRSELDFDFVLVDDFGSFEPFVKDFMLFGVFGTRCPHALYY